MIIGYVAAVGLQVVILMLGGFNDRHLLTVVQRQTAAEIVQNVQLLTLSALALIGVVLLWRRWWALPRWQRRRPAQIVINCFSLSLVMLAALLDCRRVPAARLRDHPAGNLRSQPGWRHSPSLRDCSMPASPRRVLVSCWYSCARIPRQTSGSCWPRRCATPPCP